MSPRKKKPQSRKVRQQQRIIERLIRELRERTEAYERLLAATNDDSQRLAWLDRNAVSELRISQTNEAVSRVVVDRWQQRYVSFHSFTGYNLRAAVDLARKWAP